MLGDSASPSTAALPLVGNSVFTAAFGLSGAWDAINGQVTVGPVQAVTFPGVNYSFSFSLVNPSSGGGGGGITIESAGTRSLPQNVTGEIVICNATCT